MNDVKSVSVNNEGHVKRRPDPDTRPLPPPTTPPSRAKKRCPRCGRPLPTEQNAYLDVCECSKQLGFWNPPTAAGPNYTADYTRSQAFSVTLNNSDACPCSARLRSWNLSMVAGPEYTADHAQSQAFSVTWNSWAGNGDWMSFNSGSRDTDFNDTTPGSSVQQNECVFYDNSTHWSSLSCGQVPEVSAQGLSASIRFYNGVNETLGADFDDQDGGLGIRI